ncbi:MAG TPA: hypothetical protein QF469_17565 [Sphingomonas sanguinis]|uniref:hypothetical protein n=1 Tax=Sphingomonas sanguinis TaxID=33051 RepID=UPI002AC0D79B|nr:hypothetical protein [Sphingomonas sanguinis]
MADSFENIDGGHGDSTQKPPEETTKKVCGIVMPIAPMGDDYPLEHWRRVRKIIERAIHRAGLRPQLVWENSEVDVIQSKILQNIYENDVVVCDVSALNPNVMLETGLRLSTKRPAIIVTDRVKNPPFDIGTIGYIEYQRDLEYNAIEDFIDRLVKKITETLAAVDKKTYVSFVENYRFETVAPATVTVSSEEFLRERVDELASIARRLERSSVSIPTRPARSIKTTEENNPYIRIVGKMPSDVASDVELELDELSNFHVSRVVEIGLDEHLFVIKPMESFKLSRDEAVSIVRSIVRKGEARAAAADL